MKNLLTKIKNRDFRRILLLFTLFFLLIFLFGTPYGMRLLGIGAKIELLHPSEAFEFSAIYPDGERIEFRNEGKVVFLTFFSLECPSCLTQMGILKDMKKNLPDNFSIFAVNVDGMVSKDRLKRFIKEEDIWFRIALDPDGSIVRRYGVYSLPTSFLIDKNFMIRFRFLGPILSADNILKRVSELND